MSDPRKAFDHDALVYDDGFSVSTDPDIAFNHRSPFNGLQPPSQKRLFSNRGSPLVEPNNCTYTEEGDARSLSGDEARSEKRSRTSDWPLKSNVQDNNESDRVPLRRLSNGSDSPSKQHQRRAPARPRHSKFLEGSMHDRVSTRPQASLIEEELREEYDEEQSGAHTKRHWAHPSSSTNYGQAQADLTAAADTADKSDVARHSAIFRFGKSLASSFNPTNWKIWSKPDAVEESAMEKTLRARQEKAEKVYEEMKKAGQFRYTMDGHEKVVAGSKVQGNKHHSAIQFDQHNSADSGDMFASLMTPGISKKEKRYGRIFALGSEIDSGSGHQSSASDVLPTLAESSTIFNKFNLKAEPSQVDDVQPSGADDLPTGTRTVRRIPSRKELQKERELVKKVSDLEGRLEAARRQLSKARGEQVPEPAWAGRRQFVPGALPTLLSESLLSGFTNPDGAMPTVESLSDIGKAISTADQSSVEVLQQIKAQPESHRLSRVHFKTEASRIPHNSLPGLPDMSASAAEPNSSKIENQAFASSSTKAAVKAEERERQNTVLTKTSKTPSKKRKSIGPRIPEDGGSYKPPTEPSDDDDTLPRKRASSTPRKAAKTSRKLTKVEPTQQSSASAAMDKTDPSLSAAEPVMSPVVGRRVSVPKGKASMWAKVHSKTTIPSPATPSANPSTKMATVNKDDQDDGYDEGYVQQPLRLSKQPGKAQNGSREIAYNENAQGHHQGSSTPGKVQEMVEKRKTIKKVDEEFEWPADVF